MDFTCKYCLENFNLTTKQPTRLECKCIFCLSCISILLYNSIPQSCPIHNQRVNFSNSIPDPHLMSVLKETCLLDYFPITGICKNCQIFFCQHCEKKHKICGKLYGNYGQLGLMLDDVISKTLIKSNYDHELAENKLKINIEDLVLHGQNSLVEIENYIKTLENNIGHLEKELKGNTGDGIITEDCDFIQKFRNQNQEFNKIFVQKKTQTPTDAAKVKLSAKQIRKRDRIAEIIRILLSNCKFSQLYLSYEKTQDTYFENSFYIENKKNYEVMVYGFFIGQPYENNGCLIMHQVIVTYENTKIYEINKFSYNYDGNMMLFHEFLNPCLLGPKKQIAISLVFNGIKFIYLLRLMKMKTLL